ncbi:E3 ubiquitin-protein ligase CIP8-like [Oryza brachyantha]|uniref:RING-type E3 ubiquitin transferase n=1 Tax=Oryza brachyantha TaxID=4533 RepID=J3MU04_ORYBR|nr:E3 ubiquitin-protein ligase CIP8-like [Oryza brachyantha]
MASSSLLVRLASDEILQALEAAPPSAAASCYDAFVPVFRPDPSGFSAASVVAAADRVRSQFLSVEPDLFHDALVAPGPDHLGFPDEESIRWDCLQLDEEDEPDLRLDAADEFDWEEVASPSGAGLDQPEPEWEVLADLPPPPPAPAAADEGFVYTSDRDVYEVLVGEGLFLKNKPPAARSAVEALPSAVVAAGEEGEGEECSVCRDGVAAGERVKRLPCSHRYHEECIVPWLDVRNSCPLCRFELPTDDPQYESWKASRAAAA